MGKAYQKAKIICEHSPFIFSIIVCTIVLTYLFKRPLTGFLVGVFVGLILSGITHGISNNELWSSSATSKVEKYFRDDTQPLSKAPFFFFYIWFHQILTWIKNIFVYLVILGSVAGIIWLIIYLIKKGY